MADFTRQLERAVRPHLDAALVALDDRIASLGDRDAIERREDRIAQRREAARLAAMPPAEALGYQIGMMQRALREVAEQFARGVREALG